MEFFEQTFCAGGIFTDTKGQVKPSAILVFMQDIATTHAMNLSVGRDEVIHMHNAVWILMRLKVNLIKPLFGFKDILVKTRPTGISGPTYYREFEFWSDGVLCGTANTAWVLMDIDKRSIIRADNVMILEKPKNTLQKIVRPAEMNFVGSRKVVYTDIDINNHLNNTVSAAIAADFIKLDELEYDFVKEIEVNFLKEAKSDQTLDIYSTKQDNTFYITAYNSEKIANFDVKIVL